MKGLFETDSSSILLLQTFSRVKRRPIRIIDRTRLDGAKGKVYLAHERLDMPVRTRKSQSPLYLSNPEGGK